MISQDLGWNCGAIEMARFIKNFSYDGVSSLNKLGVEEKYFLGELSDISSKFINLDTHNRFNKDFMNTCSQTAHYFFDIFNHNSTNFRRGALLTFEGDVLGVAKNFHKINFLALRSFYQKSEKGNELFYSFPLIKGVAYSVDFVTRDVFDDVITKKEKGVWVELDITDFKRSVSVVPSRVLLSHEVGGRLNLFEDYILKEFPNSPNDSVLQKYNVGYF